MRSKNSNSNSCVGWMFHLMAERVHRNFIAYFLYQKLCIMLDFFYVYE